MEWYNEYKYLYKRNCSFSLIHLPYIKHFIFFNAIINLRRVEPFTCTIFSDIGHFDNSTASSQFPYDIEYTVNNCLRSKEQMYLLYYILSIINIQMLDITYLPVFSLVCINDILDISKSLIASTTSSCSTKSDNLSLAKAEDNLSMAKRFLAEVNVVSPLSRESLRNSTYESTRKSVSSTGTVGTFFLHKSIYRRIKLMSNACTVVGG